MYSTNINVSMRKLSSKNFENEGHINANCGMAYTLSLVGGRWKPSILWQLLEGSLRYNEIRKALPNISERILILQLKELQEDGLILRFAYPEVPPKVKYQLTSIGLSLKPILMALSNWGEEHRPKEARQVSSF